MSVLKERCHNNILMNTNDGAKESCHESNTDDGTKTEAETKKEVITLYFVPCNLLYSIISLIYLRKLTLFIINA
jgi:hypothetical protein